MSRSGSAPPIITEPIDEIPPIFLKPIDNVSVPTQSSGMGVRLSIHVEIDLSDEEEKVGQVNGVQE